MVVQDQHEPNLLFEASISNVQSLVKFDLAQEKQRCDKCDTDNPQEQYLQENYEPINPNNPSETNLN